MARRKRRLDGLTSARIVDLFGQVRSQSAAAWQAIDRYTAPVTKHLQYAWSLVAPTGRAVLAVGVLSWVLAWRFGWDEMAVVAAVCCALLGIAAFFMIGTTNLTVRMTVEPPRVTVGESVTGDIEVTNRSKGPLLPVLLELPVGEGGVGFDLPAMLPGATHSELFVVPTERRGVINVGPVITARGDALGLFRRDVEWAEAVEIYVHPEVTPLEPLGAGLMRDLEGRTSENMSVSDLAFHALREYVPGDDLRHVHWRSSAKHGQLLVRQFLDTRRSHLTAVVDSRPDSYDSTEDYELAMSVAGSLLVRAVLDGYEASFTSGDQKATGVAGKAILDGCARAEPGPHSLLDAARLAFRIASDTSVLFLVTGPHCDFVSLQRASAEFPVDVAKIAVRVEAGTPPSLRSAGDLPLLRLGKLSDLPVLLKWGVPQ